MPAAFFASALLPGAVDRLASQRLAAFGAVDAAVLVGVAAREVAVRLGHELGLADEAVVVAVDAAEEGVLALELAVGRQHVARRRGRTGKHLVLAELAVL